MPSASVSFRPRTPVQLSTAACFLLAICVSFAYSLHHLPMVLDDALIGYRYVARFIEGQGLTWNDGEFVEGYSNLLWLLIIAAGGYFEPNLIIVGWIAGLLANVAALAALVWTFGRGPSTPVAPVCTSLLVLSLSSAFAFWGISGLETAFFSAVLAWALATATQTGLGRGGWFIPGVLLGLLAITRPDGVLFAGSLALGLILRDGLTRQTLQFAARIISIPFALLVVHTIFRLTYYGSLVPNTAHVKLAFTWDRLMLGGLYLTKGAVVNFVPLVIAASLLIFLWRSHGREAIRPSAIYIIPGFCWLAYVLLIGGDFFMFQRHWMPALVCLAFTVGSFTRNFHQIPPLRFATLATIGAGLYVLTQNAITPWEYEFGQKLRARAMVQSIIRSMNPQEENAAEQTSRNWYLNECLASGAFFSSAFAHQRPLLAVYHAGCLPYLTTFPSLDMLGLTDTYIAKHRPPSMGTGLLAHELGDPDYVLSRKPDLIEYCPAKGNWCRIQSGMEASPEFREEYRLIYYRVGDIDVPLWTRIESGSVGIVRAATSIYIPGFLLASIPGAHAKLDGEGALTAELEHGEARIDGIHVPAGAWEVSLLTDDDSKLRLITHPESMPKTQPNIVRIVSDGRPWTFRVLGESGRIHGISISAVGT